MDRRWNRGAGRGDPQRLHEDERLAVALPLVSVSGADHFDWAITPVVIGWEKSCVVSL